MDWSRWVFEPWSDWGLSFIAFSLGCLVLGHLSRPLATMTTSAAAAALLTITARLPAAPALALVSIPLIGGSAAAVLRAGKLKRDVFLGSALFPVCGLLAVFVGGRLTFVVAGSIAVALSKLAPRMSLRAVFVLGALPTLVVLLILLLAPQLLVYRLATSPARSPWDLVAAALMLGVAILGSMVWVEWREQRAARRSRRSGGSAPR
jgi:hypothetical protein